MTPDQVSHYKDAGYTIVPGFFAPAQTRALKREVDRWVTAGLPRDGETISFEAEMELCVYKGSHPASAA